MTIESRAHPAWVKSRVLKRVTNFQPVQYLGTDPSVLETFYLRFANPAYAARVSAHCGELGPDTSEPAQHGPQGRPR